MDFITLLGPHPYRKGTSHFFAVEDSHAKVIGSQASIVVFHEGLDSIPYRVRVCYYSGYHEFIGGPISTT